MQLNVTYDQSPNSLPAGFVAAINYVVSQFDATFTNNVAVNIDVGYGEVNGQPLGANDIGETDKFYSAVNYAAVRNALLAEGAAGATTLPPSPPMGNPGTLDMPTAEQKALGLLGSVGIDAYVGFDGAPNAFSYAIGTTPPPSEYYFVGVVEHEFTEAMGRVSFLAMPGDYTPMDLFRYAAPGVRQFSASGAPSYFSIDGGATNLNNWNNFGTGEPGQDLGDWTPSAGDDAFDAAAPAGVVNMMSAADLTVMSAIGWTQATSASPPTPTPTPTPPPPEPNLFVAYRDPSTGVSEIQLLDGSTSLGGGAVGSGFGPDWSIVALGDFNGDGNTDLVYRRPADGLTEIQLLNGTTPMGGGVLSTVFDASWSVVASGDFTGNGRSDLVYRRADGLTEIQYLNGTQAAGGGELSTVFDASWSIVATGDFNGDGMTDLVYRRPSDGLTEIQFLDGTQAAGGGILTSAFDASWSVVGAADFTGDGMSDLVYHRASDGLTEIQYVDGSHVVGGGLIDLQHGPDWTLEQIGDFNRDGTPDLLWRNPAGQFVVDFLAPGGLHVMSEATLSAQMPAGFTAIGTGSYGGIDLPVTDGSVVPSNTSASMAVAGQTAQLAQAMAALPSAQQGLAQSATASEVENPGRHIVLAAGAY